MSRQEQRQRLRQARKSLDPAQRQVLQTALNEHLRQFLDTLPHDAAIGAYVACGSEADLSESLTALLQRGVPVYLPVIAAGPAGATSMDFRRWSGPASELVANRYGILEPAAGALIAVQALNLVLVPGVGFDPHDGTRLGSGAGYYDRTFTFRRSQPGPALIGVGFRLQQAESIAASEWDVPMDWLADESGVRPVPRASGEPAFLTRHADDRAGFVVQVDGLEGGP